MKDNGSFMNGKPDEFDGTKEAFPVFSNKFGSLMSVKGLKPTLLKEFEAELPESEIESRQTSKQKKAVKNNAMVMGYIEMAMSLDQ